MAVLGTVTVDYTNLTLMEFPMPLPDVLTNLWKRAMLRRIAFSGASRRFGWLYALEDPWGMATAREQHRFECSNAILSGVAPRFGEVLEVGCGEGHQSQYLLRLADQLTGIDISELALERARRRCPHARFLRGGPDEVPNIFPGRQFDLVTACEVLHYTSDVGASVAALQSVATRIFVSSYTDPLPAMRLHFEGPGWRTFPPIVFENTRWESFLWDGSAPVPP